MATPLNIPKTQDKFEMCPYVNDMTQHQLKVLHARLVKNLMELSSAVETRAPDISSALDNILSGLKWQVADVIPNENCALFGDVVLKFQMRDRKFLIVDAKTNEVHASMLAVPQETMDKRLKKTK